MEALDGNMRFATPQDEINYWRNKAEQIQKEKLKLESAIVEKMDNIAHCAVLRYLGIKGLSPKEILADMVATLKKDAHFYSMVKKNVKLESAIVEKMDNIAHRAVIRYLGIKGLSPKETQEDMVATLKKDALFYSMVKKLQVVREEYLEFHASSKDLEEELDTTIKQLDKEKKDFSLMNNRLQEEVDSLKKKLESIQTARHYEVSKLQTEVCGYKAWKEENQKYIIRIEQLNDDLERQNRITALSLSDFEKNLNMALERNVLLENELDGKEMMREAIQRLKDEARDLRSELKAKGLKRLSSSTENSSASDLPSSSGVESATATTAPSSTDSSRTPSAMSSDSSVHPNTGDSTNCTATPPPSTAATTVGKGATISPAARISALSIVGDLLQKVGALETKLASCRNFGAGGDQSHSGLVASGSPINSPRSSRLKAGTAQQRAPLNVTM